MSRLKKIKLNDTHTVKNSVNVKKITVSCIREYKETQKLKNPCFLILKKHQITKPKIKKMNKYINQNQNP